MRFNKGAAILLVATGLIYFHSLANEFVAYDDELLIIDNPTVHGLTLTNIKTAFTSYDPELYIPVTYLLYQVEYSFFELNPVGYHAVSLLLHLAATVLVLFILKRIFDERVALILAFLFALHPLNVEAVAWASGQKDLLASFLALLSLHWYLTYKEMGNRYIPSVIAFALALASKISVVLLPLTFIVFDWVRDGSVSKRSLKEKVPYATLMIIFLVVAFFGKTAQPAGIFLPVLLAFVSLPFYVGKFLVPVNLSILYPFTDAVTITHPRVLVGMLIVALAAAGIRLLRRKRTVVAGALFFLLLLAPSLLNVLRGGEAGVADIYFASDRYVYLGIIGLLIIVGSFFTKRTAYILVPVILLFGFLTYYQSMVWKDSTSLFQHVINSHNESYVAYMNLAGLEARNGNLERAKELNAESLEIRKTSRGYYNLARIALAEGDRETAIRSFEAAAAITPDDEVIRSKLGALYLMQGNVEQALGHLQAAVVLNPNDASVHYNLGLIYEYLGDAERAREAFEKVLGIDPSDKQALKKLGRE